MVRFGIRRDSSNKAKESPIKGKARASYGPVSVSLLVLKPECERYREKPTLSHEKTARIIRELVIDKLKRSGIFEGGVEVPKERERAVSDIVEALKEFDSEARFQIISASVKRVKRFVRLGKDQRVREDLTLSSLMKVDKWKIEWIDVKPGHEPIKGMVDFKKDKD